MTCSVGDGLLRERTTEKSVISDQWSVKAFLITDH